VRRPEAAEASQELPEPAPAAISVRKRVENGNKFNGFANYETWAVSLWLSNEYASYQRWRMACRQELAKARNRETFRTPAREMAALELAKRLKEDIEDAAPDLSCSVYADLLQAALAEVDWYELATNLLDDITEDERP
jgi:hypothetical protein